MAKTTNYRKQLEALQIELLGVQRWLHTSGKRLLVIFEGRDAAGKGGTIKAITESIDTRGYRVVALSKPSEREAGQWYFQRYVAHLPNPGEMVLFDRSWYNRGVVEPAMGFCSKADTERFLEAAPVFEKLLTDDGIILLKYWLAVDQEQQEQRFAERADDPLKRWKLSPVDIAGRDKYAAMGKLRDRMIERTPAPNAPWFVADYNDQKLGRLNLIRHLIDQLPNTDVEAPKVKLAKLHGKPRSERVTARALRVPQVY